MVKTHAQPYKHIIHVYLYKYNVHVSITRTEYERIWGIAFARKELSISGTDSTQIIGNCFKGKL